MSIRFRLDFPHVSIRFRLDFPYVSNGQGRRLQRFEQCGGKRFQGTQYTQQPNRCGTGCPLTRDPFSEGIHGHTQQSSGPGFAKPPAGNQGLKIN